MISSLQTELAVAQTTIKSCEDRIKKAEHEVSLYGDGDGDGIVMVCFGFL